MKGVASILIVCFLVLACALTVSPCLGIAQFAKQKLEPENEQLQESFYKVQLAFLIIASIFVLAVVITSAVMLRLKFSSPAFLVFFVFAFIFGCIGILGPTTVGVCQYIYRPENATSPSTSEQTVQYVLLSLQVAFLVIGLTNVSSDSFVVSQFKSRSWLENTRSKGNFRK